ncbi:MAG: fibronectin type III domain-containing protein, partial [Bacteroidia bacterium]|nr:fibronectin type III domain-containing protein [Bacteroidia bacterium]
MKKRKTKLFLMSCLMACMLWATKTNATTCGSATAISPASLPISGQSVVCGGTNDITYAATAASVKTGGCANSSYYGGQEALYVFTPTTTGVYNIALAGQTYTMIMVTWGCPTTAGSTCVDGIANSSSSKNINVVLFAGQTYYIMFDTYPTPNSPCPGTFSMSFVGPPPTTPSPWSESFPSATLPTGWALSSYFGPSNSITALNTGGSSTYYLYKNIYSVGTSGGSFTTINVGPLAGTEELSFKYKLANYVGPYGPPAAGSGNFTVDISTNYGFTYTNIATVSNNGLAGWQDVNYSLAAYSGQYVKIKITGNWTSGDYYLGFDNFKIELPPTCQSPTAPSGSPTTATTANISWTAPGIPPSNGYEYAVTTSATPPGSGTPFPGTSTSVSGLTANTTYYLHVRSDCGGSGFSTWATSAPFTTPCLPASLPWSENFDGVTIPAFPSCWVKENGDWVTTNNSNSSYDADAHSGTQFLRNAWSATNEYMWTPGFTLTAGNTYEFKFWWAGDNYSGWTGDVFVNSAQSSSGATQLGTSFVTSGTTTTTTYVQETYPFTPGTTGDYYFAIRVNATASPWYLSFDDFEVSQLVACSGMPSGGTAGASINPVCSGANFDLSLTGASSGEAGLTYQWQSADDAAFTVNLTNLGTGETQTTSQTSDKYYRCIVTCTNSGLSATSTAVLVTMNTDACQCNTYCSSNFTSATYEFVTNVTFAGINNSSAGNIGGPVDYTNLSASVQQGGTYPLSVTIDADASDYVYAWIDWNGDGDFDDAGETYTLATATSSPGPHSLNIMVPCTATVGSTRMRVMVDWNNANPDPCRSATFGEAEDYCVSIAVNPVSATITGNPTGCSPVSLTASGGSTYLWSGGASPNSATNSFTASGTYTVTVTDNGCSATASETVTITPEPTANITGGGALCLGNSGVVILNFTGTPPWSYTVTGSGGPYLGLTSNASENVSVTPSAGGLQSYTVSVSDANCTGTGSGTATFEVSTAPPLTSAKEPLVPVSACSGTITLVTTQLISGQNIEYSWNTGSSSSVVLFSTS